jgi:GT2 family glycosyltransferase
MPPLSLVIATKDRPDDLRRLLCSLAAQSARPDDVVIVDASATPVDRVLSEFPELNTRYMRHWPPSAAAQRNAGIRACSTVSELIGFVDDDAAFEPEAIANMLRFWETAAGNTLGASFNMRNYPLTGGQWFKRSAIAQFLGLYSAEPGAVAPSGWHTAIGQVETTRFVEWLPSGAVVWRRGVFEAGAFDEFFGGYSYLEDLDFSYSLSRRGRLAVVADAGYLHFSSAGGRGSARQFGRVEVHNRLHFVRKHGLSLGRCWLALAIRIAMTVMTGIGRLDGAMLSRAAGNMEAIPSALFGRRQTT